MFVKKLLVKNFKKFENEIFDFNEDVNIIVGDNETGKSTILEALEVCLNCSYKGKYLKSALSTELFNNECIKTYLGGNRSQETLPEILIEAFLNEDAQLKGDNNSLGVDASGLFVRIYFDKINSEKAYQDFLDAHDKEKITTIPIEFYTIEWFSFSWNPVNKYSKKINCLFIDPSRMHPTMGQSKFIDTVLRQALPDSTRHKLNLSFRQAKKSFNEFEAVFEINKSLDMKDEISNKKLEILADETSKPNWEGGLQLHIEKVPFNQIGKGEQSRIQIKLALWDKGDDKDVIMIEEPENHLSHMNLVNLINFIEEKHSGKQVFITTHSSYVLNKLSFNKLCLLSNKYKRLNEVEPNTVKRLKRLPGYDTLRAVLAKKIILCEGPSDELILKKCYYDKHGKLPEEDKIEVIVVGGISFKNYLNIIKHVCHQVHVVKDNDGSYASKIIRWKKEYDLYDFIEVFSPEKDDLRSLEPALIDKNSSSSDELNNFAEIILSKRTFNIFKKSPVDRRKDFLNNWFKGKGSGKKKVDSAIKIFESSVSIKFPEYIEQAIDFG